MQTRRLTAMSLLLAPLLALAQAYPSKPVRMVVPYSAGGATDTVARAVGNRLRVPGPALIMGDLWLPSLLTDGEAIRVIDWEFAHAGQPAQDLGHLLAHLWMHARMATRARAADLDAVRVQVVTGYAEAGGVLGPAVRQEASRHAGCEMLARIAGPFASRFVFANSAPTSPEVEQAIATASRAIAGEDGPWWS